MLSHISQGKFFTSSSKSLNFKKAYKVPCFSKQLSVRAFAENDTSSNETDTSEQFSCTLIILIKGPVSQLPTEQPT